MGIPHFVYLFNDPHSLEIQALKQPKINTYPYLTYNSGNRLFPEREINFTTNDTFSVGNPIKIKYTFHTPLFNIERFGLIIVHKDAYLDWLNSSNAYVESNLTAIGYGGGYKENGFVMNGITGVDVAYTTEAVYPTYVESPDEIVAVFQYHNNTSNKTVWYHFDPFDFPTIYPYTAKLQAETNRAIQIQALETDTSNNVVEGLTLILAGLVPIGLVIEFWIEYTIEHYLYRKN